MKRYIVTYDTKRNGTTRHHKTYVWAENAEEVRDSYRAENDMRKLSEASHLFHVNVKLAENATGGNRLSLELGKRLLPPM